MVVCFLMVCWIRDFMLSKSLSSTSELELASSASCWSLGLAVCALVVSVLALVSDLEASTGLAYSFKLPEKWLWAHS